MFSSNDWRDTAHQYIPKVYTQDLHRWWCNPRHSIHSSVLVQRHLRVSLNGKKSMTKREVCVPPIRTMVREFLK